MIRKAILCWLLCLTTGAVTSCNESEINDKDILIIEPPYEPMFQFDEQGIPYRLNTPTLSLEMQQQVQREAIGYGWKWMQTFEILDDGFVKPEDYYASTFGKNPTSYYFKTDKDLVRFFDSDAIPAKAFLAQGFTMDAKTGVLSDGNLPSGVFPWTFYLRIWSIYQQNGRWYMSTIEPLGMQAEETGKLRTVWGCSHYYRMNASELKKMQEEHTFDYSQVN